MLCPGCRLARPHRRQRRRDDSVHGHSSGVGVHCRPTVYARLPRTGRLQTTQRQSPYTEMKRPDPRCHGPGLPNDTVSEPLATRDDAGNQPGGHCDQHVGVIHATPFVPARRRLEMVLVVVGNAATTMVRCQPLAAAIRRAAALVAMILVMRVAAIVAPVVMPVVAVIVMAVRTMVVVTLRIAVTVVIQLVLLRCCKRCARGQQRQGHEGSNETFHQRTPGSQEMPVQLHRRSFKLNT